MDQARPEARPGLNFSWRRHLPIILQSDSTECGLACLAMLVGYFDYETDVATLRQQFSVSTHGVTLARLIHISNRLGMVARPLRVELEGLSQLRTPCILHWNANHYVVLKEVKKSSVVLHDPVIGRRVVAMNEVSQRFTGVALELTPGPDFKEATSKQTVSLRALTGKISGLWPSLIQILGLAVVLEILALIAPVFVQLIVDHVLVTGDRSFLTALGIGFCFLVVLQTFVSAIRSWSVTHLGANLNLVWTTNVFSHLLRLRDSFFLTRHVGDIVSRFDSISTIQHTLTSRSVEAVIDGLMAGLTLIVLILYCPGLAVITAGAFLLYGVLRWSLYSGLREETLKNLITAARQQSFFLESVRGIRAIKLNNQGPSVSARYANLAVNTLNKNISVQRIAMIFSALSSLIFGLQKVIVLWFGARLVTNGDLTLGMLLAFVAYSDQFSARSAALIDYAVEFRMLRLQGERLAEIVMEPPEELAEVDGLEIARAPSVELRNISFRYSDSDPWILRNCNLSIASGESVALMGPSGCGKSTIAKIVVGLLEPNEGTVLIDGIDAGRLGKAYLRQVCGAVMQDDQLFAGSYADNISFFDPSAGRSDIEKAARAAAIHDEIKTNPMGYDTLVGDMGVSLSGGQKQRLILARAIYKNPKLLVLDEATSHLDIENENRVNASIRSMEITRIIVAHRPETVESADRVFLVTGGEIVEKTFGPRPTSAVPIGSPRVEGTFG